MGPYCKFCDNRCFVHVPQGTPTYVWEILNPVTILATCNQGKEFDRKKSGFNIDIINALIEAGDTRPYTWHEMDIYQCEGCAGKGNKSPQNVKHEEWCTPESYKQYVADMEAYYEMEQANMRKIEHMDIGGKAG